MTHQYKSELIKEIVETRGHEKSSLHYESECIEAWINEAKGAYPKLADYESEWLNYMVENPIGEFPYETIIDVTDATVDNVVPYAYKSAILKGDSQRVFSPTKNLFDGELEQGTINSSTGNNSDLSTAIRSKNFVEIGVNTAFTLTRKKGTSSLGFRCYDKNKNFLGTIFTTINGGTLKVTYTTDSNTVYIRFIDNTNDLTNKYQIEIGSTATDYEEPNYELKSVKMPVLTTIGKNLFNKEGLVLQNRKRVRADNGEFLYSTASSGFDNYFDCQFLQGKTIKVSSIGTGGEIAFYTIDKTYIKGGNLANSQLVPENAFYYRFSINVLDTSIDEAKIQIEVNSVATLYEPYKTNILTTNEEVELRAIGEVKDTLDCLNGVVTERIGEIVLDGSERWESHAEKTNTRVFKLIINKIKHIDHHIISDLFPTNAPGDVEKITNTANVVYLAILRTKADNLNDFKTYLSQNPMTVQYQLATESIKTVDLSVIDQDGNTLSQIKPLEGIMHISTDGKPLKPTVSMEIPVEAITQNLTSFIEEE